MAFYDFKKDKVIGDEAEIHILNIIQKLYPKAYRVIGKEARHDIIIPEINKTIEVKRDVMSAKTGNLAIETFKKSGAPSGIMVSTANYWVIYSGDEIFFLDKEKLKNYATDANNNFRVVFGGDSWATQMVLLPISKLKEQDFFAKIG